MDFKEQIETLRAISASAKGGHLTVDSKMLNRLLDFTVLSFGAREFIEHMKEMGSDDIGGANARWAAEWIEDFENVIHRQRGTYEQMAFDRINSRCDIS